MGKSGAAIAPLTKLSRMVGWWERDAELPVSGIAEGPSYPLLSSLEQPLSVFAGSAAG